MRREIAGINEGVASYSIELRNFQFREGIHLHNGDANLGAVSLTQQRKFQRGSLDYGGRFYCGSWQNLPKKTRVKNGIETIGRNEIKINGEPTVEHDSDPLPLCLLYMKVNDPPPAGDLYDIGTWPRKAAKLAL